MSIPYKVAEFPIKLGVGVDKHSELIDMGVEYGIVKKGGAWFSFGEGKFQGKTAFRDALLEVDDLESELIRQIDEYRRSDS